MRWMGALVNTRWWVTRGDPNSSSAQPDALSLGDLRFKKFGVTPEPQVKTKLLEGRFMCEYFKGQFINHMFPRK